MQIPSETQVVIDFDDNRAASALVGPYGQNLALIERRLGVVVDSRGNHITIAGSRDGCDAARRVLETLYAQATQGHELAQGDVEGAIRAMIAQGSLFEFDAKAVRSAFETIKRTRRNCSNARKSIALSCRGPRWKPASGSVSYPAICARRSIPICGRSMTRCTT
jgi:phosphate starvation-inducible PhoH-like protein